MADGRHLDVETLHAAIQRAEDSWRVRSDDPFFDARLIVDTAAHLVVNSYNLAHKAEARREQIAKQSPFKFKVTAHAAHAARAFSKRRVQLPQEGDEDVAVGASGGATPRSGPRRSRAAPPERSPEPSVEGEAEEEVETAARPRGRQPESRDPQLLQAAVACAHGYLGADRLALELVPQSRPLRQQLRSTVGPLCGEGTQPTAEERHEVAARIDEEVDRFLGARLVACDMGALFGYDCFADPQDVGLSSEHEVLEPPGPLDDGARGPPSKNLEPAVRRFEVRFWQSLCAALGRSIFGDQREDLVNIFGDAAEEIYERFEGEFLLALNSLFAYLPSWVTSSIFFAFTGLPMGTATRQRAEKYAMLHQCLAYLLQASGRYAFVSTPAWYLPLVSTLPALARREQVRRDLGQPRVCLRVVWPAVCLDPQDCIAAVHAVWGGSIPGRRARLRLCRGVSDLGMWVLRMTMGCERLACLALKMLREYAPLFESAYDRLVEDMEISRVQAGLAGLPGSDQLARHVAEAVSELVTSRAMQLKKREERRLTLDRRASRGSRAASMTDSAAFLVQTQRWAKRSRMSFGLGESAMSHTSSLAVSAAATEGAITYTLPLAADASPGGALQRSSVGTPAGCVSEPLASTAHVAFQAASPHSARGAREPGASPCSAMARAVSVGTPRLATFEDSPSFVSRDSSVVFETTSSQLGMNPKERARMRERRRGKLMLMALRQGADSGRDVEEGWLRRTICTAGADGSPAVTWPLAAHPGRAGRAPHAAGVPMSGRIPIHDALDSEPPGAAAIRYLVDAAGAAAGDGARELAGGRAPAEEPGAGGEAEAADGEAEAVAAGPRVATRAGPAGARGSGPLARCRSESPRLRFPHRSALQRFLCPSPPPQEAGPGAPSAASRAVGRRASARLFARPRASSAPAAVDTSDFDAGDPIRNTAVALALMREVSRGLSTACADGPLQLAWRTPKSSDEQRQLTRLRLSLGAVLLFAALRAPLPAWQKLGLEHFATVSAETAPCARDVTVPDGVMLMGCTPIFHTLPSVDSAKIPPRMAATFHVAVPHVLLESQQLCAVLQERPARRAKWWSSGSLLMLMVSSALVEAHTRRSEWATSLGCWKQDREAFFPLVCAFRLVLGLELLSLWNVHRRPPKPPTTEQVFRFLQDVPAGIRGKPMRFDTGAENGAQPLIPAPLVSLLATPAKNFDPRFQRWAPDALVDGAPVALQDFAAWVGHLSPGRVVYCSHRSRAGDFYLRLEDAVMVVQFKMWRDGEVEATSPEVIWDMHSSAVGDPAWWKVPLVSHVIIGSAIPKVLERQMGNGSCLLVPAEKPLAKGLPEVKAGSELIVCRPLVLGAFLGTHGELVARHQELLGPDPPEPPEPPEPGAAPAAPELGRKDRPAGPGAAAARSWRARRPVLPSSKQYDLNFEALVALLHHVSSRHDALFEAVELMLEADEQQKHRLQGVSPRPSSPQPGNHSRDVSPPAPGPGERGGAPAPGAAGTQSAAGGSVIAQVAALLTPHSKAMSRESSMSQALNKLRGTVYAVIFSRICDRLESDAEEDGLDGIVRIERVPSPEPTAKSRQWRPPTPHPSQDSEKKTRQEAKVRKNLRRNIFEALSGGFDFLSLGDAWKLPAPDKSEKLSSKALSQGKTQRRTRAETEPIPGRRLSREREANKKASGTAVALAEE